MIYIESQDREQIELLSSLESAISEDNEVRLIDLLVDKIYYTNRTSFKAEREAEQGRPGYRELVFLKLYLYGYLNGISSSRKLEAETKRNVEVMWLLGKLQPDHWVISNYRKENGESIKQLTKEFRVFLRENAYISGKTVAIDGTKIKGYTSKDMLNIEKIENRLERINIQIEKYLEDLERNDSLEEIGDKIGIKDSDRINKELLEKLSKSEKRVNQLERAKKILEEEKRNYISLNDTEAVILKSRDGFIAGYNIQSAVDSKYKMIVDTEVVTESNDLNQLAPMISSIEEEIGEKPKVVLADKGYYNPNKIEAIERDHKVECFVSIPNSKKEKVSFRYDEDKDQYICSEGKQLVLIQKNKKKNNFYYDIYQGTECSGCKLREECTKSKKGRLLHRAKNIDWVERYKKKMNEVLSIEKLEKRKGIVEHPFGTLKYWMGKIPLLLKGKERVSTEINLYATAYNIRRLMNIDSFDDIVAKINKYDGVIA